MSLTRFGGFAVFVILLFSLSRCALEKGESGEQKENDSLGILLWNTQALFDGNGAGTEYDDYRAEKGWNEEKYTARVLSVAEAIGSAFKNESPPDLIGLVEIENLRVLEDLARGPLSKYGYRWVFFGNVEGNALGIGALSRLPFGGTKVHSISAAGETAPRPILEIEIEKSPEENLVFFVCHWKSKLGGDEATEPLRRASAKVINRRSAEIYRENPGASVIVMGDLNENHDEFYRRSGEAICALLPDDPRAAEHVSAETKTDFLITSAEKPPRTKHIKKELPVFYSPWGNELSGGSYVYKKNWETIDHFLLGEGLFDGRGWEFEDCHIITDAPFADADGFPDPYTPWNGLGLSDHLPLLLRLKKTGEGTEAEKN